MNSRREGATPASDGPSTVGGAKSLAKSRLNRE
jgi:hypothetical protein